MTDLDMMKRAGFHVAYYKADPRGVLGYGEFRAIPQLDGGVVVRKYASNGEEDYRMVFPNYANFEAWASDNT